MAFSVSIKKRFAKCISRAKILWKTRWRVWMFLLLLLKGKVEAVKLKTTDLETVLQGSNLVSPL